MSAAAAAVAPADAAAAAAAPAPAAPAAVTCTFRECGGKKLLKGTGECEACRVRAFYLDVGAECLDGGSGKWKVKSGRVWRGALYSSNA